MAGRTPLRVPPPVLRLLMRGAGRFALNPRLPYSKQRTRLDALNSGRPLPHGTVVLPVEVGGRPALRVSGPSADPSRLVVHLHGGGYCTGSPATAKVFAAHLARAAHTPVLLPDYRLAPEHPFPAALDDALAVWRSITGDVAPARVALFGDSAGAGLAVATALHLRDAGEPGPGALGLISPWLDLTADRNSNPARARRDPLLSQEWLADCVRSYAGGRDPADPALSPLFASPSGLPPLFVVAASDDVLVPDADQFVLAARDAGIDVHYTRVSRLWHDYPLQAGMLAAADRSVEHLAAFLQQVWDRLPVPAGADGSG